MALKDKCIRPWMDEVAYEAWQDMRCLYFVCEEDSAIPVGSGTDGQNFSPIFHRVLEQILALAPPVRCSSRGGWSRKGSQCKVE